MIITTARKTLNKGAHIYIEGLDYPSHYTDRVHSTRAVLQL